MTVQELTDHLKMFDPRLVVVVQTGERPEEVNEITIEFKLGLVVIAPD